MAHGVEADRLEEARAGVPWKRWGPYLSERQWGTVREDYSDNGDAWNYFSHDQARSRAYKWGEDGIAGFCDDHQRLCFGIALWNGVDPILKERMFGLTNSEGNHGEDVKEYYFYLDATPTSSYLKYRYRYPLGEFPYADLVATNRARSRLELEYELLDTGVFDDDRYVDVDVEYAKSAPDDVHVRITLINRSRDAATVHLLPSLWFRNTWWMDQPKGVLHAADGAVAGAVIAAEHPDLGHLELRCEGEPELLFTENETNSERLWGVANPSPYVKDAFHEFVVHGQRRRGQPGPYRHEGGRALRARCRAPAAFGVVQLRLCPRRRPGARRRRGRPRVRIAHRRCRRVLRIDHAVEHLARRGHGHAPGPGRNAVGEAALQLRSRSLARGAPRAPAPARRHVRTSATRAGST